MIYGKRVPLDRCARRYPFQADLLRVLAWAREGHFPVDGGTLNQTRGFMQLLDLFIHETNDLEKKELNRERSRQS